MKRKPIPKVRKLYDIQKTQKKYSAVYGQWYTILMSRDYSSFPSENSPGWPNHSNMHSVTALQFKEKLAWKSVYSNGYLQGSTCTPDQYLMPDLYYRQMLETEAMNKAMAKFMDGKQQLMADFGERRKTIDMITKRVRQAYDVLRLVKKGRLYSAVQVLKGGKKPLSRKVAELRLEFAYGWKPLVGSLYDIAQKEFPPDPELYISEAVTRPFVESDGETMETTGRVRAVYSMLVSMHCPMSASAEKLGLTNPASVAWELVPFSFVVDWFIPISTYLQNLTAFNGYTVQDKCLSYKEDLYCTNHNAKENYGRTKIWKYRSRSVHIDPGYRAYPKNPLSIAHALNALALIRVLRK